MEGQINRLRRCEKITAPRPRRLGRLMCGKPSAFQQAPQPKCFNVKPEVRKGRAFPQIGRQSRDFFTPPEGLKRQRYGRAGLELLRARLLPLPVLDLSQRSGFQYNVAAVKSRKNLWNQ